MVFLNRFFDLSTDELRTLSPRLQEIFIKLSKLISLADDICPLKVLFPVLTAEEDTSPFCGATDTPVLDFWLMCV